MKSIAILIRDFSQLGGGERDVATLIEGLNEYRCTPDVYSEMFSSISRIERLFQKKIEYNERLINRNFFWKIISDFFRNPLSEKLSKYEFVLDFTGKPPLINKNNYIKYLYFLTDDRSYSNLTYKLIKKLYSFLNNLGIRKFSLIQSEVLTITQSRYIQSEVYRKTGKLLHIIYPPVNVKYFKSTNSERLKNIISIGRLSYEKNQVEQIYLAKLLPNLSFFITGSSNRNTSKYVRYLKRIIADLKLRNVQIIQDVPAAQLRDLLKKSLFFLHTTKFEHFGISTVEAIASGCIPIVHDSGGQVEIVPFKKLRFQKIEEAARLIDDLCTGRPEVIVHLRDRLQSHIYKYDEKFFKSRFLNLLNMSEKAMEN